MKDVGGVAETSSQMDGRTDGKTDGWNNAQGSFL